MILLSSDGEFNLTEDMIQSLRLKFPHVDVDRELAGIHLWLHRNPSRRWKYPLRGIEKCLKKKEAKARANGAKLHIVTSKQAEKWWETEEATVAYAEKIGMPARPGETFAAWRKRLRAA